MDEKKTRRGRLEDWHEVKIGKQTCMFGRVFDLKNGGSMITEGEEMITSEIQDYFHVAGVVHIHTYSGSIYQLGEPAKTDRTFQEIFKSAVESAEEPKVLN